ncbi:Integrator complex subunit 9 [Massospora cicadina]|nr:Integrator complex subunit 9 [Massospora cicadina]
MTYSPNLDLSAAHPDPGVGNKPTRPLLVQTPFLSQIDTSQLAAIILTHPRQMLGLPYISELSDFSGLMLATEPALQFGRQLMEEFVEHFGPDAHCSNHPPLAFHGDSGSMDKALYNIHEAKACIEKIRPVQYNERTVIRGSANWLISFGDIKLGYVSASTRGVQLHPLPLDVQLLKLATHFLVTEVAPETAPSPVANLSRIGTEVVRILRQGGSVLFPCHIQGAVFDLIATIGEHLESQSLPATILVVSPVAEAALHYANIAGEWMNSNLQQMVYLPEMPLGHGKLMASGRLKYFANVHSTKFRDEFWDSAKKGPKPSVVFASHPSLRAGPALHLVRIFKDDPRCAIIFTDPFHDGSKALATMMPMSAQVQDLTLELRLGPKLVFQLIQDHQPKAAILPRALLPALAPKGFTATTLIPEACSVEITLAAATQEGWQAVVTSELAKCILPKRLGHLQVAPVKGILHLKDGRYTVDVCPGATRCDYLGPEFILPVTPACVLKRLLLAGFVDVEVVQLPQGTQLIVPSLEASILFMPGKIQIATQDFQARVKLTEYLRSIRTPGFEIFSLNSEWRSDFISKRQGLVGAAASSANPPRQNAKSKQHLRPPFPKGTKPSPTIQNSLKATAHHPTGITMRCTDPFRRPILQTPPPSRACPRPPSRELLSQAPVSEGNLASSCTFPTGLPSPTSPPSRVIAGT